MCFLGKDDVVIFEQNLETKILWVEYDLVWKVFRKIFEFKYGEIQSFINTQVEEHLNLIGYCPIEMDNYDDIDEDDEE